METKRVLLAVDAANLFFSREAGQWLDYAALLRFARQIGDVVRASLYHARCRSGDRDEAFLAAVEAIGYDHIVARPLHRLADGTHKSDIDVALALHVWDAALFDNIDVVVLASGDSDFVPLLDLLSGRGIEVYVIGPDHCTSASLIQAADWFAQASSVAGLVRQRAA